ncbi:MAG: radical SAM protein [Oscillospiraceae bacterium]|nr:radical SAM protein [Oscillospiraceae bacterium]
MSARQTIIPVFVPHVGCPNDCVFCNQRRISGAVRPITPEELSRTICEGAAVTPNGVERQLAFYGGSFTAIPVEAQTALLEAAQPYLADGTLSSLRLSTRPDAIDEEILLRLRRYGVRTIELGAQSMDDTVLTLAGRGHTAARVTAAAAMVKAYGFELILQMMTGLPGDEDGEASLMTARTIAAMKPHGVRIYPTVIVRDTALYEQWKAGSYKEHTVEAAVELCARIVPIFQEAEISIIRLGLNPTEDLSAGDAAAGAYHPALGEMVRSRMMLNTVRSRLEGCERGSRVLIEVGKGKTSQMIGQKRCNVKALQAEFGLAELKIREIDRKTDEIFVNFIANLKEM